MAAQSPATLARIIRSGMGLIEPAHGLRAMEAALATACPQVDITLDKSFPAHWQRADQDECMGCKDWRDAVFKSPASIGEL